MLEKSVYILLRNNNKTRVKKTRTEKWLQKRNKQKCNEWRSSDRQSIFIGKTSQTSWNRLQNTKQTEYEDIKKLYSLKRNLQVWSQSTNNKEYKTSQNRKKQGFNWNTQKTSTVWIYRENGLYCEPESKPRSLQSTSEGPSSRTQNNLTIYKQHQWESHLQPLRSANRLRNTKTTTKTRQAKCSMHHADHE